MATADTTRFTKLDIIVKKGGTLNSTNGRFTVKDDAGASIDLSGYDSGTLKVYSDRYSTTPVMTFSTADSSLVLNNGSFDLVKSATLMDALAIKPYYYEVEVISGVIEIPIGLGQFIVL